MPTLKNYEAVEGKLNFNPMFKGGGNQDTDATFEAFQEMPSSSSGKLESICEHNGKGKRQQKEIFDESKRIEDPNNMPIHQKETSIMIARKVCDETVLSGLSMDIVPASSYGKASAWIFGYSSLCPVGILGLWIPRHLCITTGSKILKDFVDSCAVTSVATSIESSLIIEANTQQNKHSDICIKTKEVKLLRSPRNSYMENFLDSLKSTRGMIEQGGWIVVVIVACGLLLIGG
ncbi:hypothetical protein HPP92_008917 [Vanilla planifolia]|nr:hypothetical protein HPP92_008917 [Vanilla planifolia]